MNIDNQIFYIVILIFTCLVLLCIALIYLYISAINKYNKIRVLGMQNKIDNQVIINSKEITEKVDKKLSDIVDQIIVKWQQSAEDIFTKNAKVLDEELKKTVTTLYQKETLNLDLYKKEKIKEFDELVLESVTKLSKQILSKEIDLNDHKKLIKDGLERAKLNGLFK